MGRLPLRAREVPGWRRAHASDAGRAAPAPRRAGSGGLRWRCARRAATLGLLLLATGCVPPGLLGPQRVGSEERRAFEQARAAAARDPAQGAEQLSAFLARWPRSPLADDAGLRLAQLELERGRKRAARERLEWVIRNHPKGDRSASARLLLAELEYDRGDLEGAWRAVAELRLSLLPDSERREAHRLLAVLARERKDAAQELHWLTRVAADERDPATVERIRTRMDTVVAGLETQELVAAAERLERRLPAARLWLEAAERALSAGDRERAKAYLARAAQLPLSSEQAQRHIALEQSTASWRLEEARHGLPPRFAELARERLPSFARVSGTLGVVLPLSGPLAQAAEQSLQGVLLAADVFAAAGDSDGGVRVLVRDSGGHPEAAARAMRELARERGLSAVIGPLVAEEAGAAGEVAEQAQIPLLALTRNEEVARGRSYVFRLGLTPEVESEALAEHAIDEVGLTRFAILYPRDRYGREFERLFWRAVEARGGQVVGVAGYEPTATDFGQAIRSLIGFALLTPEEQAVIARRRRMLNRAKRLPPQEAAELRAQARALQSPNGGPLPPFVDFEALFIPDSYDKVALIAPQLAFHEVEGVRLLGASGWNHADLIRIGRRHVEGAVFTTAFDERNPFPLVREFARRYQETFGEPPSVFSAQAFDAANLALLQLLRGHDEPAALRHGLLEVQAYPGVSGVTALLPDGNARKRPFLVGVRRGQFVSLE